MSVNKAKYWLWFIIIYSISTFILSSASTLPTFVSRGYHLDWILHGIEYGIFAVLTMKYFSYSHFIGRRFMGATVSVILSGIIGGLNELFQGFVPQRSPTLSDQIANLLGAIIFISIYLLISSNKTVNSTVQS